MLESKFFFRGG